MADFDEEERMVLLEASMKKLEESAKTLKNEIFSYYPHGLASGIESQISRFRRHHRKPFDFHDEYEGEEESVRAQKEDMQSRANLKDYVGILKENKALLEKCYAYISDGKPSSKLLALELDVKMCEATLAYIEQLVEIAGTWKKLEEFMGDISRNDR